MSCSAKMTGLHGGAAVIGPDAYNDTAVLRVRADRWLAAARTNRDAHLELFTSNNEGQRGSIPCR